MSPERVAVILEDIRTARDPDWLGGYVGGLRVDGAMGNPDIAVAVRDKYRDEGWTFALPEWATSPKQKGDNR